MKINLVAYLGLAAVLLIGLFLIIKSQQSTSVVQTQTSTESSKISTNSAGQTNTKTFELVVKNRKLVIGPETLTVNQGDNVTIKTTVDEDEELHLHGYDKSVDITKNQPAELKFIANLTGRFPYELEHSKTEIGALEVLPK